MPSVHRTQMHNTEDQVQEEMQHIGDVDLPKDVDVFPVEHVEQT